MKQEFRGRQKWTMWLRAAALGAAAMYFFDTDRGRQRRTLARDKIRSLAATTGTAINAAVRDARNRFGRRFGQLDAQNRHPWLRGTTEDNQVVAARVRAKLGRVVSHPHAIDATVQRGHLILRGPILASEKAKLLEIVQAIPGIASIEDQLDAHDRPDGIAALQGGRQRQTRPKILQQNWTPALRGIAVIGGGVLGYYGSARRTPAGVLLAALGLALFARGASNRKLMRLIGIDQETRIDIQKTIDINAPPETIFDLWSRYENFPNFISHVLEVRDLGGLRAHWVVKGSGGARIEWDTVLTEHMRPTGLAWQSEPGAAVTHAGSIRFEPKDGSTRVTVRMSYRPPAGSLGQGLAVLLGSDPKRELGDDLTRMKSFIESGTRPHDAAKQAAASSQSLH